MKKIEIVLRGSESASLEFRQQSRFLLPLLPAHLPVGLSDRLLYKCERIQLSGGSYRMENRKTIFAEKES